MAFSPLEFTKSWENSQDFPTYEPDEKQVRADLQLLHNETRDWINGLVRQLNDPTAAAQLPFAPEHGLTAQTVQAAVLEVYAAIQQAAAGLLVDGSVTREKLAAELLDRTYGGRIWTSLDSPGSEHNPDTGFPVGQLWLRPGFSVENLLGTSWRLDGGTLEASENGVILTTDGSLAYCKASQTLAAVGTAGQRVFVSIRTAELDDHLQTLTLYLNGAGQDLGAGGGVFEATPDENGNLELVIHGQWPYAEADASVRLVDLAVVNADAAEEALQAYRPLSDWPGLIQSLTPFARTELERQVFLQIRPGQWEQVGFEALPVSRGGTGVRQLQPGQLLVGSGTEQAVPLDCGTEGNYLQIRDGMPCWRTREQTIGDLQVLQMATGSYTGVKTASTRTVTLTVTPKLLFLFSPDGVSNPIPLISGAKATQTYRSYVSANGTAEYAAHVVLQGNQLQFSCTLGSYDYQEAYSRYCNEAGKTYHWVALY